MNGILGFPKSEFVQNANQHTGIESPKVIDKKEYDRQYYIKNKEHIVKQTNEYAKRNCEKIKKRLADYYIKHQGKLKGNSRRTYHSKPFVLRWAQRTIYNHRQKGQIVNITAAELVAITMKVNVCPFCGCELIFYNGSKGKGQKSSNSVSLDRKNNEDIINKDNVLIICVECNRTKGGRTTREFYDYCKMVLKSEYFENEKK